MILSAVFLLSCSSLCFEVLLTRIFSITQFNHLAFMVISIALFGFAVSGTFLNIIETRRQGHARPLASNTLIFITIMLYSFSAVTAFIILGHIPLDYFRLPLEPIQMFYLLTAYLLLALPFFFAGLVISIAYAFLPEKSGLVYWASMSGSACGAILPVMLIPLFGEGKLVIFSALIPLTILPFARSKPVPAQPSRLQASLKKRLGAPAFVFGIVFYVVIIALAANSLTAVKPSPYKALSQMLQFPDTLVISTTFGLRGRIDFVKSPYLRFAPGLSLKYTGTLPSQSVMYKDGDNPFYFYDILNHADKRFADFTLLHAGYLLASNLKSILLIQHGGGGLGIPCALAAGAQEINVVLQHPVIADCVRHHYKIPVINQHPRVFLAQSQKRYDLIHIENWGTSLPGSDALSQYSLFTVESMIEYLNHLNPDGILMISRKLLLPPTDSIRLCATAFESLKHLGLENPGHHIAMLRDWSTFTLIVSAKPLLNTDILVDFARKLNFDLVYLEGLRPDAANRFNIFNKPFHFLEIKRLAEAYQSGTEKAYFADYPLDVVPQTDHRPFPGRFLKWPQVKTLYKMSGSRFYSLFMSGEIVVAVVFIEAALVAVLLLVLPLATIPKKSVTPRLSHLFYFLAVGAGFMFLELFFIKKYIFVFGDPVVSFTVVLTAILVFSGLGGYYSQRIGPKGLRYCLAALIAALILTLGGLDRIVYGLLTLGTVLRYITAFLLLMPCGILAGLPFPLGMRHLLQSPDQRAYAWSANGCASVLASIAASQLALSLGIPTILFCAIAGYFLALICAKAAMLSVDKNTKI